MAPHATQSLNSSVLPATTTPLSNNTNVPYIIPEEPFGTKRKFRVGFLGAGVSSLSFFRFAEEKLENVEVVCWEKNKDIGGTWLENRYAGCACDIPSVNYQFSWRTHVWSKYYSPGPEIWDYLKMVERENKFIDKYVKLRHKIISASWTDEESQWTVKVKNLETDEVKDEKVDFLLNGGGVLNNWKWPDTPGLKSFKGQIMHSARWDDLIELEGKRIAVIGAGSSAVQIIPTIYPKASKMYHWVRSPVWITAGFAQEFAGKEGRNYLYTDEQKEYLRTHPNEYLAYRKLIENEINKRFHLIVQGTPEAKEAREYSINEMKKKLASNPALADAIIPQDFGVGCRRPTPGTEGYLEALSGPKMTPYTVSLEQITEKGFLDPDGKEVEVDVIICATGFDTSFAPSFDLRVNNESINEKLFSSSEKTLSYLSLALPGVPNYLTFCGPFGPVAHGSFFPLIEAYTNYANAMITKIQTERIKSVRPKLLPCVQFRQHAEEFLKRTAWTGPCSSWFKNGKKEGLPLLYPGSRCNFLRLIDGIRWEDWEVEHGWSGDGKGEGNMWAFLGNGFNSIETQEGEDITWYLGGVEKNVDIQGVRKMMMAADLKG